ncbi:hypothetical protein GOV05_01285 [Candidatus Woesearchaeota archaeon]|nr:hypothetical protein [Candidatus Woesearchaeota archaeon]
MEKTNEAVLNLALDTIKIGKQSIIFVNTKRSAESVAEKISKLIKEDKQKKIADKSLKVLSRPTKQCERLSRCLVKGVAFHHSGLPSKQRELIEDNFRESNVSIIVATPTLAYGLDMPAYRVIIRDLKRYGGRWGMEPIQVLEYHQMSGRAGRPGREDHGETICLASSESEEQAIKENFLFAPPEDIYSKLAAEPILRTYILSLIATGFANNIKELYEFFERTFYAHQYGKIDGVQSMIDKVINQLEEWEFLKPQTSNDFKSANGVEKLEATKIGVRVAELYLDPLTAYKIIEALRDNSSKTINEFGLVHLVCTTLELRPLFRVGAREHGLVLDKISREDESFLVEEPDVYEDEYDEFLNSVKTALVFDEWMNEADEQIILEKYNVRPGEFNYKRDKADWILYCAEEFARMIGYQHILKYIKKTRYRAKHGVKEELFALLKLRNIGRVRARKLFNNKIKDLGDIRKATITTLTQLLGEKTAQNVKEQIGQ